MEDRMNVKLFGNQQRFLKTSNQMHLVSIAIRQISLLILQTLVGSKLASIVSHGSKG